jgi:hypothetical protein
VVAVVVDRAPRFLRRRDHLPHHSRLSHFLLAEALQALALFFSNSFFNLLFYLIKHLVGPK